MKIVSVSSIKEKASQDEGSSLIISELKKTNNDIVHEHYSNYSQQDLDRMSDGEKSNFHEQLLKEIKHSDIVVAECSSSSLSVGFLISFAINLNKPTLVFYAKSTNPPNLFPTLLSTGKLYLIPYTESELKWLVTDYINEAKAIMDVRFNFFVSPKILAYLDHIAKEKRIPRSVFLRNAIEEKMREDGFEG